MSFTTKIVAVSMTALVVGAVITSGAEAQTRGWNVGAGAAFATAAAINATTAASRIPYLYPAYVPHHCRWIRNYDAFGNYLGKSCVY
jgi:hypothetical protein